MPVLSGETLKDSRGRWVLPRGNLINDPPLPASEATRYWSAGAGPRPGAQHPSRRSRLFSHFQSSSICKTAVHAGVIQNESGGYVDLMPVDKKKAYVGSLRNGVQSER